MKTSELHVGLLLVCTYIIHLHTCYFVYIFHVRFINWLNLHWTDKFVKTFLQTAKDFVEPKIRHINQNYMHDSHIQIENI